MQSFDIVFLQLRTDNIDINSIKKNPQRAPRPSPPANIDALFTDENDPNGWVWNVAIATRF